MLYELKKNITEKTFHCVRKGQCCPDMKKVTLEKVRDSLKYGSHEVQVPGTSVRKP